MTRINVVAVTELNNQHLMAEYKEITRPFNKVIARIEKYGLTKALDNVNIPDKYVLGKGHESFFFNKLSWLFSRYKEVYTACINRGFSVDWNKFEEIRNSILISLARTQYWNDYTPTYEDKYVNMTRLIKNHSKNNEDIREELVR
jgi:hypothetical protein